MCTHVCKCKNDTCSNYSSNWEVGEEQRTTVEGVNSFMTYLIHCRKGWKCHTVPPPSTTIKKIKAKKTEEETSQV
jgi:hypothetical protein